MAATGKQWLKLARGEPLWIIEGWWRVPYHLRMSHRYYETLGHALYEGHPSAGVWRSLCGRVGGFLTRPHDIAPDKGEHCGNCERVGETGLPLLTLREECLTASERYRGYS